MRIVVGHTSRPESVAALERAAQEAILRDAELIVAGLAGSTVSESQSQVLDWSVRVARWTEEGERVIADLTARGIRARYVLEPSSEDPASWLLQLAEREEAELIVIGLRRRSAVGKLVLGSVSQRVILEANCPVLAVKAEQD
jgi:nucleotide-binding universal stress UspA family protein